MIDQNILLQIQQKKISTGRAKELLTKQAVEVIKGLLPRNRKFPLGERLWCRECEERILKTVDFILEELIL